MFQWVSSAEHDKIPLEMTDWCRPFFKNMEENVKDWWQLKWFSYAFSVNQPKASRERDGL